MPLLLKDTLHLEIESGLGQNQNGSAYPENLSSATLSEITYYFPSITWVRFKLGFFFERRNLKKLKSG